MFVLFIRNVCLSLTIFKSVRLEIGNRQCSFTSQILNDCMKKGLLSLSLKGVVLELKTGIQPLIPADASNPWD